MNYTPRSDVTFKALILRDRQDPLNRPGEGFLPSAIFELDTGDLVAVHYTTKRTPTNSLSCRVLAWLIDGDGDAQQSVDDAGVPIVVDFKHNASAMQLSQLTAPGLAATLRDLVLGEAPLDPPTIPWSQEVRDEVNVRYAIAAARATGETVDLFTVETPEHPPIYVEPDPVP